MTKPLVTVITKIELNDNHVVQTINELLGISNKLQKEAGFPLNITKATVSKRAQLNVERKGAGYYTNSTFNATEVPDALDKFEDLYKRPADMAPQSTDTDDTDGATDTEEALQ